MPREAKLFVIRGRVQGVGYRFFVERLARAMGIAGYVRNCTDGSVEVYAIGEPAALSRLRKQLEVGPPASRVEEVREFPAQRKEYKDFVIEPGV